MIYDTLESRRRADSLMLTGCSVTQVYNSLLIRYSRDQYIYFMQRLVLNILAGCGQAYVEYANTIYAR